MNTAAGEITADALEAILYPASASDYGKKQITHKDCVKRMSLWLRNSRRHAVVLAERNIPSVSEQPDVFGWVGNGESTLIECKVSRADFNADKNKVFRRYDESGVGDFRYFAAPSGVLKAEDMPDGWGLLEITEYQVRERKPAILKRANKSAEVAMLIACIRRLELSATVFVRHEGDEEPRSAKPVNS